MEGEDFSASSTPMQHENELDISARDVDSTIQNWKLGLGHLLNHLHMTISFLFLFMAFRYNLDFCFVFLIFLLMHLTSVLFRILPLLCMEKLDYGPLRRFIFAFVFHHLS